MAARPPGGGSPALYFDASQPASASIKHLLRPPRVDDVGLNIDDCDRTLGDMGARLDRVNAQHAALSFNVVRRSGETSPAAASVGSAAGPAAAQANENERGRSSSTRSSVRFLSSDEVGGDGVSDRVGSDRPNDNTLDDIAEQLAAAAVAVAGGWGASNAVRRGSDSSGGSSDMSHHSGALVTRDVRRDAAKRHGMPDAALALQSRARGGGPASPPSAPHVSVSGVRGGALNGVVVADKQWRPSLQRQRPSQDRVPADVSSLGSGWSRSMLEHAADEAAADSRRSASRADGDAAVQRLRDYHKGQVREGAGTAWAASREELHSQQRQSRRVSWAADGAGAGSSIQHMQARAAEIRSVHSRGDAAAAAAAVAAAERASAARAPAAARQLDKSGSRRPAAATDRSAPVDMRSSVAVFRRPSGDGSSSSSTGSVANTSPAARSAPRGVLRKPVRRRRGCRVSSSSSSSGRSGDEEHSVSLAADADIAPDADLEPDAPTGGPAQDDARLRRLVAIQRSLYGSTHRKVAAPPAPPAPHAPLFSFSVASSSGGGLGIHSTLVDSSDARQSSKGRRRDSAATKTSTHSQQQARGRGRSSSGSSSEGNAARRHRDSSDDSNEEEDATCEHPASRAGVKGSAHHLHATAAADAHSHSSSQTRPLASSSASRAGQADTGVASRGPRSGCLSATPSSSRRLGDDEDEGRDGGSGAESPRHSSALERLSWRMQHWKSTHASASSPSSSAPPSASARERLSRQPSAPRGSPHHHGPRGSGAPADAGDDDEADDGAAAVHTQHPAASATDRSPPRSSAGPALRRSGLATDTPAGGGTAPRRRMSSSVGVQASLLLPTPARSDGSLPLADEPRQNWELQQLLLQQQLQELQGQMQQFVLSASRASPPPAVAAAAPPAPPPVPVRRGSTSGSPHSTAGHRSGIAEHGSRVASPVLLPPQLQSPFMQQQQQPVPLPDVRLPAAGSPAIAPQPPPIRTAATVGTPQHGTGAALPSSGVSAAGSPEPWQAPQDTAATGRPSSSSSSSACTAATNLVSPADSSPGEQPASLEADVRSLAMLLRSLGPAALGPQNSETLASSMPLPSAATPAGAQRSAPLAPHPSGRSSPASSAALSTAESLSPPDAAEADSVDALVDDVAALSRLLRSFGRDALPSTPARGAEGRGSARGHAAAAAAQPSPGASLLDKALAELATPLASSSVDASHSRKARHDVSGLSHGSSLSSAAALLETPAPPPASSAPAASATSPDDLDATMLEAFAQLSDAWRRPAASSSSSAAERATAGAGAAGHGLSPASALPPHLRSYAVWPEAGASPAGPSASVAAVTAAAVDTSLEALSLAAELNSGTDGLLLRGFSLPLRATPPSGRPPVLSRALPDVSYASRGPPPFWVGSAGSPTAVPQAAAMPQAAAASAHALQSAAALTAAAAAIDASNASSHEQSLLTAWLNSSPGGVMRRVVKAVSPPRPFAAAASAQLHRGPPLSALPQAWSHGGGGAAKPHAAAPSAAHSSVLPWDEDEDAESWDAVAAAVAARRPYVDSLDDGGGSSINPPSSGFWPARYEGDAEDEGSAVDGGWGAADEDGSPSSSSWPSPTTDLPRRRPQLPEARLPVARRSTRNPTGSSRAPARGPGPARHPAASSASASVYDLGSESFAADGRGSEAAGGYWGWPAPAPRNARPAALPQRTKVAVEPGKAPRQGLRRR